MAKNRKLSDQDKIAYLEAYHRVCRRIRNSGLRIPPTHRVAKMVGIPPATLRDILRYYRILHIQDYSHHSNSCVEVI